MIRKLDKDRPYATIHGLNGVAFEQDELMFNAQGELVSDEAPVEIPKIVVEFQPEKPPKKASVLKETKPIVNFDTDKEPWDFLDQTVTEEPDLNCPEPGCNFVGKSKHSLAGHMRVMKHGKDEDALE